MPDTTASTSTSRTSTSADRSEKVTLQAHEFQLLGGDGQPCASLSAVDGGVALRLGGTASQPRLWLGTDASGAALRLFDASGGAPRVEVSLDALGTHVFLAGDGGQQSYLFLKNGGASGVVLVDRDGQRRAQLMVGADGQPSVATWPAGAATPPSASPASSAPPAPAPAPAPVPVPVPSSTAPKDPAP